jgi:secondary thiamine-phosphate synthase enzyme
MAAALAARRAFRQATEMQQAQTELTIATPGAGLHEFTGEVVRWVAGSGITAGLLTLFVRHTSCSLLIQENAAPAARRDLERYFARIAPENRDYEHDDEGPDDMPAHLRAALTAVSLSIPVAGGRPVLGTWQGVYLFEHRAAPHRRRVAAHLIGD